MAEKTAAKNKSVSQIGLNTHSQDHEFRPVTLSTTKISVKTTIGSFPDRPYRLDFFSVRITAPPQLPFSQAEYTILPNKRTA